MDIGRQASEIISDAERRIQELVRHALQQRDYEAVQRLSAIARSIAEVGAVEVPDAAPLMQTTQRVPAQRSPKVSPTVATTGSHLPRFFKDGSEANLVKLGYSKSDRRTYEHRSPRDVLDRLVGLIVEIGTQGRRFTTDQILPAAETRLADVPSYQVYLCLAFLVQRGIVRKIGRLGYVIDESVENDVATAVHSAWEALPVR
jgi:hypothetical protein